MAQNEVQVKVMAEVSNQMSFEQQLKQEANAKKERLQELYKLEKIDLVTLSKETEKINKQTSKRIYDERKRNIDLLLREKKIDEQQYADLAKKLANEDFNLDLNNEMRIHKIRMDDAKKEARERAKAEGNKWYKKDLLGGVKSSTAGKVASSVGGALGNAIPGIGMMANPITMASAALTGTIATGAAVGKSSIQQYASYEQARNKTQTLAGSSYNKEALDKKTMEVASATKFNQTDVANAVNVLIQGGKSFDEAMAMVGTVANTALAHGKTIEESAGLLIATSNQFGLKAEDVGKAADIFTKATTVTALDFQAIQDGMKNAGPALSSLGQGVALTTAQLGALANIGISGSEAGTALKSMVAMTTSQQGQNTLSSYGVSLTNEDGSMRAINEIFAEFKTALDATGKNDAEKLAEWKKVAGEFTGQAQALADSNETIKELTVNLEASANATTELAQTQQQGINGLLDQITSNWEIVKNMIGEYLAPLASGVLEGIRDGIVSAFSWLSEVFKVIQQMFAPFIDSVKGSTSTISSVLTGAIGAAIIATMTLVTTISVIVEFISKFVQTLCDGIIAIQDVVLEVLRKMPYGDDIADAIEKVSPVSIIKDVGTLVEESKKGNELSKQLTEAVNKNTESKQQSVPDYAPQAVSSNNQQNNNKQKEPVVLDEKSASDWADELKMQFKEERINETDYNKLMKLAVPGTSKDEIARQNDLAQRSKAVDDKEAADIKARELKEARLEAKYTKEAYDSAMKDAGVTEEGLDQWSKGQFEVASKFSGTTASMSSYAQFDWEATGVDEKQLEELKSLNKNGKKLVSLLERSNDAQEKVENLEII